MENRADQSILDLTLRARYLRSITLAHLLRRALYRIRGATEKAGAPRQDSDVAFERR